MKLKEILELYKQGEIDEEEAGRLVSVHYSNELGFAHIDLGREHRNGFPEVIYCEGKTIGQVQHIVERMNAHQLNVLGTRASKQMFEAVKSKVPSAEYNELARTITVRNKETELAENGIAIIAAGTSDLPVAEEARITAEFFGNKVETFYDVGVAGIHRLFGKLENIRKARVVIVVAGMEGALASVVGGLVDKPIIAVPTSIGYGANFGGLSALLAMLNSCAIGVSVVNIDNGFGAACQASMINKL